MSKEDKVSIWEDEKVLAMDCGLGCRTMWMDLLSLNCTLKKSDLNGKFYIMWVLTQFKNR